ncbi:hypothetical protein Tco_0356598 [Tanacetum coccineum]
MKMEILLEPTSNKLMVEHAEFDESNTYVLERFDTSAGNPVKEILLKLSLPDHRIFKDGGEASLFLQLFRSTGLHLHIPGYEDPALLLNKTEYICILLTYRVTLNLAVTLHEVAALYELCKKLGRSIINDGLIHKVRMIFGFRSRKRTAAREPLQMKATISMPVVRCSGPGKLMIVTGKKNRGLYTGFCTFYGPFDFKAIETPIESSSAKPETTAYCQEAYWLEKSWKDWGLDARKLSTKVNSTEYILSVLELHPYDYLF